MDRDFALLLIQDDAVEAELEERERRKAALPFRSLFHQIPEGLSSALFPPKPFTEQAPQGKVRDAMENPEEGRGKSG